MQFRFFFEGLRKEFVDYLGLRQAWIDHAIAAPDQVEVITHEGLTVNLYLKNVEGRRPSALVVMARPDVEGIGAVVRLYNDFERDIRDCTPLELVEMAAERFGITITVGNAAGKFFLQRDIPLRSPDPTDLIGVPPKPDRVTQVAFVGIFPGPPAVAKCALVFALDVDAYRAYLDRWK